MRLRTTLWIGALCCVVTGAAAADSGVKLTKREKIRAFAQVQTLKALATWEAKRLHPENAAMRTVEEKKAVRQAFTAVAGQYQITATELRKIVVLGLRDKWPAPGPIRGGQDTELARGAKAKAWRKIVCATDGRGRFRLVKDKAAQKGIAAESSASKNCWLFACNDVHLPAKGTYRIRFYCRLIRVRARGQSLPGVRARLMRFRNAERTKWTQVAHAFKPASELSRNLYTPITLDYKALHAENIQVALHQTDVILRVNRIVIEKVD